MGSLFCSRAKKLPGQTQSYRTVQSPLSVTSDLYYYKAKLTCITRPSLDHFNTMLPKDTVTGHSIFVLLPFNTLSIRRSLVSVREGAAEHNHHSQQLSTILHRKKDVSFSGACPFTFKWDKLTCGLIFIINS